MFFRSREPFDYPGIEPPFQFVSFDKMNEVEAQRHFDWFVAQSEPRRKLLLDMLKATGGDASECDYAPESLVALWKTVPRFFEEREMTPEEKNAVLEHTPAAAREIKLKLRELNTATRCLAIDIGFYVAEVFMRRFPQVHWELWMKKEEGEPFSQPVLGGFKLPLIPSDMVVGSIWKHFKTPNETLLLDVYHVWEKDLL